MDSRNASTAAAEARPEFSGRVLTTEQPLTNAERELAWRLKQARQRYAEWLHFAATDTTIAAAIGWGFLAVCGLMMFAAVSHAADLLQASL